MLCALWWVRQVVLVNPVTLESLAVQVVPANLVIPATPALRERQAPHLVAFRRWSRPPTHQGQMEMQHLRLEVLGTNCSSCILFMEPLCAGWHGDGLKAVWWGTQASGVERGAGRNSGPLEGIG